MLDLKWVLIMTGLLFGGLYSYKNFFSVDTAPLQTRVSEEIGMMSVRVKASDFGISPTRDTENYLIFIGKSTDEKSVELARSLAELYDEKIKGSQELEVIHYNVDESKSVAYQWAKKEKFPWPILLHLEKRVKEANLVIKENFEKTLPQLILIDQNGEVLSTTQDLREIIDLAGL